MTPEQEQKIIERLGYVEECRKEFDAAPSWHVVQKRGSQDLYNVVAIRLRGALRGGVFIRIATPIDAWEADVYGHIEVQSPGLKRRLRLCPVEWRPMRAHENSPSAPEAHRFVQLWDRWHPFDLNRPIGIRAFDQTSTGVAVPLPRAVDNFSGYCDLCSDLWRCPDMMGLEPPPWSRQLL